MKRTITAIFLALIGLLGNVAAAPAPIAPFEPRSLDQILAAHKGQPFVLILWSLDCVYCQASLTVLSKEKRVRPSLSIVTLSTDAVGDPQTDALVGERLRAFGLTSDAWAFGAVPPEQLRYAVDPKWHGEMPRSYWFDARGKRIAYSGVLTPAVIEKLSAH